MKKLIVLLLLVTLFSTATMAGDIRLGIFTGVAVEDFARNDSEFEPEDYASTIPFGIQAEANVLPLGIVYLATGIEATFLLSPYTWEMSVPGFFETSMNFNQNLVGLYAKVYVLPGKFQPYAKLGVGYYYGNFEVEMTELITGSGLSETEEIEVDPAIGINLGLGLRMGRFFLELDYHGVERGITGGADVDLDENFDTSTMTYKIGYQFYL